MKTITFTNIDTLKAFMAIAENPDLVENMKSYSNIYEVAFDLGRAKIRQNVGQAMVVRIEKINLSAINLGDLKQAALCL